MIEIIVVMVIIATIVVSFSSRMGRSNRQLRKDVRYFAGTIRDVRIKARLKNLTYRLVITMPQGKDKQQSFWVEASSKATLLRYDDDSMEAMQTTPEEGDKDEDAPPPAFSKMGEFTKDGERLPEGLFFKSVELPNYNKEFTSGRIYIHFFPEGRVEESIIHITTRGEGKDELQWSLAIHPLTGRVDTLGGYKTVKDLEQ